MIKDGRIDPDNCTVDAARLSIKILSMNLSAIGKFREEEEYHKEMTRRKGGTCL